ncbi:13171_t:CDS:2, partial [Gigaspora margarita]
ADEDGWNVAAKMASNDLMDPMSQLFESKREKARLAAQSFPRTKRSKYVHEKTQFVKGQSSNFPGLFANSQFGQQPVAPSPMQPYPYFHPTFQFLPNQQGLSPGSSNFGANVMSPFFATQQGASLQNSFPEVRFPQHRYQDSGFSNAGSSRRYDSNREVVCYLCDAKKNLTTLGSCFKEKGGWSRVRLRQSVCNGKVAFRGCGFVLERNDKTSATCARVVGEKDSPFSQGSYKFSLAAGTKVPDLFCGRDRMDTEGIRKI